MAFLFQRGQLVQDQLQKTQMRWEVKMFGFSVRRTKYHPVPARGYTKVQVKALELVQWNMQSRKMGAFFSQPNHIKCTLAEGTLKTKALLEAKVQKVKMTTPLQARFISPHPSKWENYARRNINILPLLV